MSGNIASTPGPLVGVGITTTSIESIVSTGWPGARLESVTPLAEGKSFNNRIYFLTIQHVEGRAEEAVLKVIGRYFDASKVQNEVAWLRIMEVFCPDVPAPRLLAWSEDGSLATFMSPHGEHEQVMKAVSQSDETRESSRGWILSTRLPGEPLVLDELDHAMKVDVMTQLADVMASWRHKIPHHEYCGSLQFTKSEDSPIYEREEKSLSSAISRGIPGIVVRGLVMENIKESEPIQGLNEYYSVKLADKLNHLESSTTLAQNRHLVRPLRQLNLETIPNLEFSPLFPQSTASKNKFVFTHYDLSPRNVLVTGSPPKITGIVDFEFAGFFSPAEEFLNDYIGNEGDWPRELYETYLGLLEERGVATPKKTLPEKPWELCCMLETLISNVAPWWLNSDTEKDKLERELREASDTISNLLTKIGSM